MASADDITRMVEPGSLEYGDRQALKGKLETALAQGGGGGGVPQPGPTASTGGATNPMSRMLGKPSDSELPVTDGLSVGPGAGPGRSPSALAESPRIGKLRMIALEAKSPLLRYYARLALRTEIRNLYGR